MSQSSLILSYLRHFASLTLIIICNLKLFSNLTQYLLNFLQFCNFPTCDQVQDHYSLHLIFLMHLNTSYKILYSLPLKLKAKLGNEENM